MSEHNEKPVAVITGASAGLGRDLARLFAGDGHDLLLVARREDRLQALAEELQAAHGIRAWVLAVDLAEPDAAETIAAWLADQGVKPGDRVDGGKIAAIGDSSLSYVKSGRNRVLKVPN